MQRLGFSLGGRYRIDAKAVANFEECQMPVFFGHFDFGVPSPEQVGDNLRFHFPGLARLGDSGKNFALSIIGDEIFVSFSLRALITKTERACAAELALMMAIILRLLKRRACDLAVQVYLRRHDPQIPIMIAVREFQTHQCSPPD
jgi:hypothetical protein